MRVRRTWDGAPVAPEREVAVRLARLGDALEIRCTARLFGDDGPPAPPGPTDRLWEHEVVEVFIGGVGEGYLEIELGPYGNHLVLELASERVVRRALLPIEYHSTLRSDVTGRWWTGRAHVPWALLPAGPHRLNAYAIQPSADGRVFLAAWPPGGPRPDFHRPESFRPIELSAVRSR